MKMLDDKQREKEAIANLTGDVLLNPTFPEGVWRNPSTDKDVPYHEMRWHVFKEMEPTKCWIGCATMCLSFASCWERGFGL